MDGCRRLNKSSVGGRYRDPESLSEWEIGGVIGRELVAFSKCEDLGKRPLGRHDVYVHTKIAELTGVLE